MLPTRCASARRTLVLLRSGSDSLNFLARWIQESGRLHCSVWKLRFVGWLAVVICSADAALAADLAERLAAERSITSDDLQRHVDVLADDTFEGREAGTRGGRAAAKYLARFFEKFQLTPAGEDGGYYQTFGNGCRNVLGVLDGSDPQSRNEVIVVGAHYDHVGYGTQRNSFGPTGYIHNGADDNASGTAGILELLEAFDSLPDRPRRSILFAFWDGEEQGLLGSKHWVSQPTVPLDRVKFAFNIDMIGRLRGNKLEVYGTRTAYGLRRFICQHNQAEPLEMEFKWEMKPNSDHYSFFEHGIPVLMPHTGLHDDYHRPSDDAHTVNSAGMEHVSRLLFNMIHEVSDSPTQFDFREASRDESDDEQRGLERPTAPRRPRLGVSLDDDDEYTPGVIVTRVHSESAAQRAGLRVGDRILQIDARPVESTQHLIGQVLHTSSAVKLHVEREDENEPLDISIELDGRPLRVGVAWREDDAEPGTVLLTEVVPGSPAGRAGLAIRDRIYRVDGRDFADGSEFKRLVTTLPGPIELLVERRGRLFTVSLGVPPTSDSTVAAE